MSTIINSVQTYSSQEATRTLPDRVASTRSKIITIIYVGSSIASLLMVSRVIRLLFTGWLYNRDYSQIYLMGLALRSGVYLYDPIPVLADRFDPSLGHFLPHASAYPPIVALLGVPLSMIPYFWSVVVWSVWEIGCLIVATILMYRHFSGRKASLSVLVTLGVFISWQPIFIDLIRGQVMLTILLLLTLTWLAFRSNRDVGAGLLLGLSLSLKFYGWPIFILFVLMRRWKAVFASAGLFAFCNALMVGWLGIGVFKDYFLTVAPGIAQFWTQNLVNFSAMSFGNRLIGPPAGTLFFLITLCICIYAALRARDLDHSFMVMLAASTILAPISWIHYFVTLLPALCLVASRKDWESREVMLALVVATVLFLGIVPYTESIIRGILPLVGVSGLIWLLQLPAVRDRAVEPQNAVSEVA
jgi:glycosyl transferase family 87